LDDFSALAVISKLLDKPVTMGQELADLGLSQFDITELASDLETEMNVKIPYGDTDNWLIVANIVEALR
jgi:acyl carrier protein